MINELILAPLKENLRTGLPLEFASCPETQEFQKLRLTDSANAVAVLWGDRFPELPTLPHRRFCILQIYMVLDGGLQPSHPCACCNKSGLGSCSSGRCQAPSQVMSPFCWSGILKESPPVTGFLEGFGYYLR
ncbi:uncharacterized protein LOC128929851 [Callithrix jacchus]